MEGEPKPKGPRGTRRKQKTAVLQGAARPMAVKRSGAREKRKKN